MNKYEQLQKFLNKCIALGWKPRGREYFGTGTRLNHWLWWLSFITDKENNTGHIHSIHDIFAKESWIMEFVDWEHDSTINQITVHWVTIMDYDVKYNYMIMSEMTADEKVTYFLENALLPNKQD